MKNHRRHRDEGDDDNYDDIFCPWNRRGEMHHDDNHDHDDHHVPFMDGTR